MRTTTVGEQTSAAATQICAELLAAPLRAADQVGEDQIAWRQAERYVARLVRCTIAQIQRPIWARLPVTLMQLISLLAGWVA